MKLRRNEGIKQAELAEMLGVSVNTYRNYEHRKTDPSLDSAGKLARYFNRAIDDLFDVGIGVGPDVAVIPVDAEYVELAESFARLDDVDRSRVRGYLDGLLAGEKYQ